MSSLNEAFEAVADWCEKHPEGQKGREIGMHLGSLLRVYSQLANLPDALPGDVREVQLRVLNGKVEKLLSELADCINSKAPNYAYLFDRLHHSSVQIVNPLGVRTNMMFDPRPMRTTIQWDGGGNR